MRWLPRVIARDFRYSRPSSSISRLLRGVNRQKTLVCSGPAWQKRRYPRRMRLAAVSVLISKLLPASSSDKIGSVTFNSDFYTWGGFPPPHPPPSQPFWLLTRSVSLPSRGRKCFRRKLSSFLCKTKWMRDCGVIGGCSWALGVCPWEEGWLIQRPRSRS